MKRKLFLKWMIIFSIILFLLPGCGGKSKSVKTIQGDPETLYKQGLALFNKRDYQDALKKFEELKSNFPDSPPYTVWAELKGADSHFMHKSYVEAIAAYEEFKKVHPTHEEIQYVQYQIAMAYFNQMLSLDRDQTATTKALSNFEYLIANYPPSIFTGNAKEKVEICRKRLADHEFYISDFYYRRGRFRAAASRLETLLNKYPKVPEEDKTLLILGKSYLMLNETGKAKEAFTRIVLEYPQSPYYKEAKTSLDHGEKIAVRKGKEKAVEKKGEPQEAVLSGPPLVKFEEEGKQPVSFKEEKRAQPDKEGEETSSLPASRESVRSTPSPSSSAMGAPKIEVGPAEEKQIAALPSPARAPVEEEKVTQGSPPEEKVASLPVIKESVIPALPSSSSKTAAPQIEVRPAEEKEIEAPPSQPTTSTEAEEDKQGNPPEEKVASLPVSKESVSPIAPPSSSATAAPKIEVGPAEEKGIAALPGLPTASTENEKKSPSEMKEASLVDKSQPIDIVSDKVESYSKDNLIVFKGNVMARQKDIVMYSDSLEAVVVGGGHGIEKAIAGGNVKIQMGVRMASCQKAVFYNVDQKVVLMGDPKVSEGDNVVSGDEITYDIEKDRFDVKGGPTSRGRAVIHPQEGSEKKK